MTWHLMTTSLIVALAVAPAAARQSDAITAARFSLTIDGTEIASFAEMGPLPTGPRPIKWPTIVLKRGSTAPLEVNAWHDAAQTGSGRSGRRNAVLVAYDRSGKPVAQYRLTNAWPSKVQIGGRGGSDGRRAETVVLVCERIERVAY